MRFSQDELVDIRPPADTPADPAVPQGSEPALGAVGLGTAAEGTPPYAYSFDFDFGLGPWTTWMAPSVVHEEGGSYEAFTRLNAPGLLDPNHIDGIGALRLVAHLSIPAAGSPGILNLTDAEFEITIRATDFQANGGKLVVWILRYIPEEGVYKNYYVPLVSTNWANTGNDLTSQLVEGEWRTITVRLSDDPADWTYAGENQTQQGDWADRYQPYDLTQTLAHTDATLHLVFINDEPDEAPTGFLDIANITVRTHEPAIPVDTWAATHDVFYGLEDQDLSGTLPGDGVVDLHNATFAVVAGSERNGVVTLDAATGAFTFTPNADYFGPTDFAGPAMFRYSVTDGTNTAERTAYFYIGGVNDRPTATLQDESVDIRADTPFSHGLRIGDDVDANERLTYRLVDGSATNGVVTIDPDSGRYTFTPTAGFSGPATFSYVVSDGQLESEARTVTLTVLPGGEEPVRLTYSQAVELLIAGDLQGFVHNVMLLADAGDVNAAAYYGTWLRYGQHVPRDTELAAHYLELARGIPDVNIILADMYATGEGVARDAAEARVLLEALPTNAKALYQLAVLYDHGFGGPVDDVLAVETYLLAAKLGNADAMYTVGRRYLSGEGVGASAADAYFWLGVGLKLGGGPALEVFDVQLLFNMQQAADLGLTPEQRTELDDAIAAWTVGQPSPVNDAPVAGDDPDVHVGPSWQSLSGVLAPASDADGDRLTYQLVPDSADNGTVTLDSQTGAWVFTGTSGYSGPAQFRYVVSDGQATSDEQTVSLTLELVTHAVSDAATLKEATTLTVPADGGLLANDSSSLAGGSVRVGSVNGEAANVGQPVLGLHGSITIDADGSYTFVPDPETAGLIEGESATDSFTYSIVDDEGVTSAATLTLTITGVGGGVFYGNGRFIGSAYGDLMTGGTEADVIIGNGGDDIIDGGFGAPNELYGGTGNDIFIVRNADDMVVEFEGEGVDGVQTALQAYTLAEHVENLTYTGSGAFAGTGNAGANSITGGAGNDILVGLAGDDTLIGGLGDDWLRGGAGLDLLIGGAGIDAADYTAAAAGVVASLTLGGASDDGDGGTDSFSGIENLIGSAFGDQLTGNGANNRLWGGAGDDILRGLAGDDIISGGAGNDVLEGGSGTDLLDYSGASAGVRAQLNTGFASNDGDGGSDTISGFENLTGSDFDDLLVGDAGGNIIRGGLGADILIGGAGNDILYGGPGASNELYGGLGDDYFVLEANDTVVEFADEGIDTVEVRIAVYNLGTNIERLVFGGVGNFTGTGNALNNTIIGGAGDDILRGRGGDDELIGGDGSDTADYSQATSAVLVRLDSGIALNDGEGGRDVLTSIENITGSQYNDVIVGDAGNNVIRGGLGSDVLLGGDGDDILMGGQISPNQLHGGRGNDWFILDAADSVIEYEGEGVDTVEARISSYHLAANVENLIYTGPASFSGWGNELDNHITGGGANDYLRGMGGNDIIDGGAGLDTLYLRGLAADYTITAEGEGYRIDDAVAGRDGSTFVLSIEYLRYSNGSTGVLTYPPAAAAGPGEAKEAAGNGVSPPRLDSGPGKDDSGPQVLPPGFDDDAFLAGTGKDDHPLVLPGAPDAGIRDFRTGGLDDLGRQTQLTAFEDPTHVPDVDGTGLGRFDSGGLRHGAPAFGPWGLVPDDHRLWAGLDARLPLSGPATDHDPWG